MADYYVNHGDSSSPDWVATTPVGGAYDPVNSGVAGDTGYDTGTIWLWVSNGAWVNNGTSDVPRWHYLMYSTYDPLTAADRAPSNSQDYLDPDTVWVDTSTGDIYRNESAVPASPDWQLDATVTRHSDTRAPVNPVEVATPGDAFALWINSLTGDAFVNVGSSAAPDWQPQEPTNQSRPPRSSLDSVVVYPPSLAETPFDPSSVLPKIGVADYIGQAKAIHVQDDSFSVALDPIVTDAFHAGQSPKVASVPSSPPQWDSASITSPPDLTQAYYTGVSEAIYVAAPAPHDWPPVDPIDPCGCEGADCGITDTFTRTVAEVSGGLGEGAGAWGTADCGTLWDMSFAYGGTVGGVDGSKGYITTTANRGTVNATLGISPNPLGDFTATIKANVTPFTDLNPATSGSFGAWMIRLDVGDARINLYGNRPLDWTDPESAFHSVIDIDSDFSTEVEAIDTLLSGDFWLKLGVTGGNTLYAKAWKDGDPEPDWQTSQDGWDGADFSGSFRLTFSGYATELSSGDNIVFTFAVDSVDLTGVNSCSDCGITDTFTRTVADGWGASDAGLPWQVFDTGILTGSGFSVDGAVASATLVAGDGTSIGAILYTPAASMLVKMRFTGDGTTDDRLLLAVDPGTGGGSDPGSLTFYSDGEVWDGTGIHASGITLSNWFWFREESGNYRVWADGSSEPSSWTAMRSGYVSGRISFDATHLGASSWLLEIDDLDITDVNRCTAVQFDDFNRTLEGDWGTATPSGYEWTTPWNDPSFPFGVDGSQFYADISMWAGISRDVTGEDGPWARANGFVMLARCQVLDISSSGFDTVGVTFYVASSDQGTVNVQVANNSEGLIEVIDDTYGSAERTTGWATGWFWVKWERRPGGVSRVKVWNDGDAEPVAWDAEATAAADVPTAFSMDLESHTSIDPARVRIDSIDFDHEMVDPCVAECVDPITGLPIPDFTPGYLPTFRYQIGDPTTNLDSYICTLEAAAMVLDWHTRGAVKVWGGELIPYCGKSEADIYGASGSPGTSLANAQLAWLHWGQLLEIHAGGTWAELMACLSEGRAVILQGDYGELPASESCQAGFEDNHAISLYPYIEADRLLVGDPLCSGFKGRRESSLQAYAEGLGVAVYGVTSPQKILFAASRPWAP